MTLFTKSPRFLVFLGLPWRAKNDAIYDQFQRINDYYPDNDTIGAFVYAFGAVCDTVSINTATTCEYYVSDPVPCIVITQAPSKAPTKSPIEEPTDDPTSDPTLSRVKLFAYRWKLQN